jgi:hypothetical protein
MRSEVGDFPFKLGKRQKQIERRPPHRGCGVELLGDRDERDAVGIEQFDQLSVCATRLYLSYSLAGAQHELLRTLR